MDSIILPRASSSQCRELSSIGYILPLIHSIPQLALISYPYGIIKSHYKSFGTNGLKNRWMPSGGATFVLASLPLPSSSLELLYPKDIVVFLPRDQFQSSTLPLPSHCVSEQNIGYTGQISMSYLRVTFCLSSLGFPYTFLESMVIITFHSFGFLWTRRSLP